MKCELSTRYGSYPQSYPHFGGYSVKIASIWWRNCNEIAVCWFVCYKGGVRLSDDGCASERRFGGWLVVGAVVGADLGDDVFEGDWSEAAGVGAFGTIIAHEEVFVGFEGDLQGL